MISLYTEISYENYTNKINASMCFRYLIAYRLGNVWSVNRYPHSGYHLHEY